MIDALRSRYKHWLWDAEYRDTLGATVAVDSAPHRLYSVFRTQEGELAVVVVNEDPLKDIRAAVKLQNPRRLTVITPERSESQPTAGVLEVRRRSAAVIIEQ